MNKSSFLSVFLFLILAIPTDRVTAEESDYDPEARKKKQDDSRSKKDQRLDDLRQILNTAPGRRYMKGLLTFHGVYQQSMAKNTQEMAEEKGRRNAGLKILEEMKTANAELTIKMLMNQ